MKYILKQIGNDFIISEEKEVIGKCSRCNSDVVKETDEELKKDYSGYCPECDENLYEFEIIKQEK